MRYARLEKHWKVHKNRDSGVTGRGEGATKIAILALRNFWTTLNVIHISCISEFPVDCQLLHELTRRLPPNFAQTYWFDLIHVQILSEITTFCNSLGHSIHPSQKHVQSDFDTLVQTTPRSKGIRSPVPHTATARTTCHQKQADNERHFATSDLVAFSTVLNKVFSEI